MKMKKHHLTRIQEYQLGKFLEPLLTKSGEFVVYKEGWNDDRVATECSIKGITRINVTRFRGDVFGKLSANNGGQNPLVVAHNKIADLTQRVAELEKRLSALEDAKPAQKTLPHVVGKAWS